MLGFSRDDIDVGDVNALIDKLGMMVKISRLVPSVYDGVYNQPTWTNTITRSSGVHQQLDYWDLRFYPEGTARVGDWSFFMKSGTAVKEGDFLYPSGVNRKFEVMKIIEERHASKIIFLDVITRLVVGSGVK